MSLLKANSVQIGQSSTATNNFTLSVPSSPDGTIKLARGNSGATTADVLTVNASGAITGATISGATINSSTLNGGSITLGTAQNSTSGTAIDFTGIPSWAKKITVMFNGVSTSGTSIVQVQIGSGSISSSGYTSACSAYGANTYFASDSASSGFLTGRGSGISIASSVRYGKITLELISSNVYIASVFLTELNSGSVSPIVTGGNGVSPSLSGVLDRVRITTVNGTDTFDAGSINIMYEG